jgi:hypothetical protein
MSQHTPGPWTLEERNRLNGFAGLNGYALIGPKIDAWHIHRVGSFVGNVENAQLIAAAPDLLAACEELNQLLSNHYANNGIPPETVPEIQRLRAAIAKAKPE